MTCSSVQRVGCTSEKGVVWELAAVLARGVMVVRVVAVAVAVAVGWQSDAEQRWQIQIQIQIWLPRVRGRVQTADSR